MSRFTNCPYYYVKNAPLKPFATKGWPFYRRMQEFMPGTQPRGTHSFDPGSSSLSSSQALNLVNAENDGEEDQAGPPVETSAEMPAAFTSAMSTLFPSGSSADDAASLNISQSNATRMPPPFSSSVSPTTQNVSVSSAHTTSSDACRKRKFDTTEDMPVSAPRSKRSAKARGRTETLNPVIISSQLNSTLSRLADIMDKSLDASHTQAGVAIQIQDTAASGSSHPSSIPSQPPNPSSTSDSEALDKALGIVANKDFFSKDDLLAASFLFSNTSNDVVRIARNFLTLSDKPKVQQRFLFQKLKEAGLHLDPGKGKGRAVEPSDDDFPMLN